jgi:hypothetical protein
VRRIVATACVLVFLAISLLWTRNTPRTLALNEAGCTVANAPNGSRGPFGASICFPAMDAEPWDYFQTARETCAEQRVDDLAREFETKPKAVAVAQAYSQWMRSDGRTSERADLRAVYAGCMEGLRED